MTASKKQRILIVDDNPDNLTLIERHLSIYNFDTATDGDTALALVKKNIPDLIILDIMLPGLDGFAISGILKEEPETADIPILYVSAKTNVGRLIKEHDVEPDDFVETPYEPEYLRQIVKRKLAAAAKKKS